MMLTYERHVLRARVNTFLGTCLLGSVALLAAVIICEASWGTNPVVKAFSAVAQKETQLQ